MNNCVFCNRQYEEYKIKEYNHWEVQLFVDSQYYLGRCVIVLRGRHIDNLNKLKTKERVELFEEVIPALNTAIDSVFSPDLYNYSSLGNDCRHLHMHVIPRYKNERSFCGTIFEDEFWNKHYAINDTSIVLDDTELEYLQDVIQKAFPKS